MRFVPTPSLLVPVLLVPALLIACASCAFGERTTTDISGGELEERFASETGERWARGELEIGGACEQPTDCFSGLCVGGFCTQDCKSAVCPSAAADQQEFEFESFGSQCTAFEYPCDDACEGATRAATCLDLCADAVAQLCMRTCESEGDCAEGTDCLRNEDNTYSCQPWVSGFSGALACIAFTEFASGVGTPPQSCSDEEGSQ
jgi:hypothetical protein